MADAKIIVSKKNLEITEKRVSDILEIYLKEWSRKEYRKWNKGGRKILSNFAKHLNKWKGSDSKSFKYMTGNLLKYYFGNEKDNHSEVKVLKSKNGKIFLVTIRVNMEYYMKNSNDIAFGSVNIDRNKETNMIKWSEKNSDEQIPFTPGEYVNETMWFGTDIGTYDFGEKLRDDSQDSNYGFVDHFPPSGGKKRIIKNGKQDYWKNKYFRYHQLPNTLVAFMNKKYKKNFIGEKNYSNEALYDFSDLMLDYFFTMKG